MNAARLAHVHVMIEVDKAMAEYRTAPDSMAMPKLAALCAWERAAKIIADIGIGMDGSADDVVTAIRSWQKDFDGPHMSFAYWNRMLMYAENIVRGYYKEAK